MMDQELVLQISTRDGKVIAELAGGDGRVLAAAPASLDAAMLDGMAGPEVYGHALAEAVFKDEIRQALKLADPARVRLVVSGGGPEFHDVRWECLLRPSNGPMTPLATGPTTPFSRLLNPGSKAHARPPQIDWPLRIVVAISNPSDLSLYNLAPVDVSMEWDEFQRSLRPLQGLVEVERVEAPICMDRICQALEKEPRIFHFLGHGAFHEEKNEAALFLEREGDGRVQVVRQKEWAERLKSLPRPPHLIVLAACESSARVNGGVLVGLAPAFIHAGAGAVVAMRDRVGMDVAREFIYHFYRRLATHGEIDLAVNEARSYLLDRGGWSWSIPTLFLERGAERIFAADPDALEAEPARPDEILVLIPEFKGHEESFFELDLRDTLQVRVEEADLKRVRVVWLKKTVIGPGEEDHVRRLAARYGAALVIWGWYDRTRFRACFTVTDSLFTYRDPQVFRGDAGVRGLLYSPEDFALFVNQKLPRQVEYFVFFFLGQLHYWERNYERAMAALNQAIAAAGDPEGDLPEGMTYAYFYRGNVNAVFLQDRMAAIADYRKALSIAPTFVNAAFNLAGSFRILANTMRARGEESPAVDNYRAAIDAYTAALKNDSEYILAYEGRGLAHYEIGQYGAAMEDFQSALKRNPRADTHHKLGLALRNLNRLDEALAQLNQAVARAPGTADYYFSRGRVQAGMKNVKEAVADFRAYLRLSPEDEKERRSRVKGWLSERGFTAA